MDFKKDKMINDYIIDALNKLKIKVKNDNGEYRTFSEVMDELAQKWEHIED